MRGDDSFIKNTYLPAIFIFLNIPTKYYEV